MNASPGKPKQKRIFVDMKYVYLIKSISDHTKKYVGVTSNVEERLKAHNAGESSHTSKYRPWELIGYSAFANDEKAYEFEKYLKSHSGRAFANKRFW